MFESLKVYSPGYQAINWGFDYPQVVDLTTALAQPTRIAALPVHFDNPRDFAYKPEFEGLDLTQFDLVLFTDIEFRKQTDLMKWIETTGAKKWLLSVGGLYSDETLDPRTVYRPAWMFTFLQWNPPREEFPMERPFIWECLLGARRDHRDFVMLSFQQSGLLTQSIVNYRNIFMGSQSGNILLDVKREFPDVKMQYPYVSPNLDPAWEVRGGKLDNSISSDVPWEIWNRCYYSIIIETLGDGNCFLAAEKIGKCLLAKRLFVHFGVTGWLANLHKLGFKTFDNVLDESYDTVTNKIQRWKQAFEQVKALSKENPQHILEKVRPILDYNRNRLFELHQEKFDEMQNMITPYLK
jgi:hypothetical protein